MWRGDCEEPKAEERKEACNDSVSSRQEGSEPRRKARREAKADEYVATAVQEMTEILKEERRKRLYLERIVSGMKKKIQLLRR